jgi:Ser/Thr protein kinase RdoA (MazF antagonist)
MQHAQRDGLTFVPDVMSADDGLTWVEYSGRLWDLTSWMPGKADFHDSPSAGRMAAALVALARIHNSWSTFWVAPGRCPAIDRRLDAVARWQALVRSGWQPDFGNREIGPARPWAEQAWQFVPVEIASIPATLGPFQQRSWQLQSCLCDIWHDHVLFEGDAVTGIIDYGSAKMDHVAVDLARLLGSMAGDDSSLRGAGLQAYTRIRPLSSDEESLVQVLDETGTIIALGNWLRWLYHENRQYENYALVAERLRKLVERMLGPG